MEIFNDLLMGFSVAITPINLLFALFGVFAGTIIGALPGVGPPTGVAVLMPLTFGMNPTTAMIMLAGIYYGAMYGGTITSVLINTPGESSSVMTAVEGYQMALKGKAGVALGIATIGSFIAGTFGVIMLTLLSPALASFALKFGPPQYFALMFLGLVTLTSLSGGNSVKGFMMTIAGLLLAMVGMDAITGKPRFIMGNLQLLNGFDFLPAAMGLFGISEVLVTLEGPLHMEMQKASLKLRDVWPKMADWVASRWAIARGTLVGFFVGVLPGSGATIASFASYAVEKKFSKHPEEFGKGAIEGVAGPESANNAASAAAMVPLLTLGIPSSATTAILLGAMMMYGLRPGPLLFDTNPDLVWGLIASMYIGNVLLVLMNIGMIPAFVSVLRTPVSILMPLIVVFTLVGSYSANNNLFDVWVMLCFGFAGYFMKKFGYPAAPVVLALVLGPTTERTLRQSLMMSRGSLGIFFSEPIAATLMTLTLIILIAPLIGWAAKAVRGRRVPGSAGGR
ncbi:MAG: tripartite tricarboxylate transporter permease [Syntrophothermus sp.]